MKTLSTHPSAQVAFTPVLEKPKRRSQPSLLWELRHFFIQCCCHHPHPTAHPHLGPERVSLPYFTEDHVVGSLFPVPAPLHPDLGLPITGVSRPDSCGPCGEQLLPHPRAPAPLVCL